MNSASSVTVITGASRGLGLAIASRLLARGHRVLALQRQPNATLEVVAARHGHQGARLESWAVDLVDAPTAARRLQTWVEGLPRNDIAELTLINNAALLVEPGPLAGADLEALSAATRVGIEAPLLLTCAFLKASTDLTVPRKVLNISSGLGQRAMAGSTAYCATKAGLDHLSRSLALEEAERAHGARIVSLAPGVIDTDMQVQLRSADPASFSSQARFAGLKAHGQLDSADQAADKVLAWLDRPDFGETPVADVREA